MENKEECKKKDEIIKYLTSIYQNISTALQSIEDIMTRVEDENLKKELSNEYSSYDVIGRECEMLAKSEDINLKDNSIMEKIRLWSSIKMTTMIDKTTRHLAQMLLLGTVMGLIQCLKDIKDYEGVSEDVNDLCVRLHNMEEENYQTLKKFI